MNIACHIDTIVQDIKRRKISFAEVQKACLKIMISKSPQTPLEKRLEEIMRPNRVRVEYVLEKIYEETEWMAQNFQDALLSMKDIDVRYLLFCAFSEPLDFEITFTWWDQSVTALFTHPFDTKDNFAFLVDLLWKLAKIPLGETFSTSLYTPEDQETKKTTYFEVFLWEHIDKSERFFSSIFKKYPKEAQGFKKNKKVKTPALTPKHQAE